MSKLEWLPDDRVKVEPPKRPKKITGTRFAAIMGLNKWNTEFKTWCEITKTWQEPFVDTIYTIAGKVIEPKQAEYMRKAYGMSNLVTPTDVYGPDYFSKTFGDFFPQDEVFGGMWDYLLADDGVPSAVLEMKTTKRSEDWANDVPEYYAMQAALYAHLLGVDDVIMVCSFLADRDYEKPEEFVPSADNTITVEFKVSERYPNFDALVAFGREWWDNFVTSGLSPYYDNKKDAEIIAELREMHPDVTGNALEELLKEGADLQKKLAEYAEITKPMEDRLKAIKEAIKEDAVPQIGEDYDKVLYGKGSPFIWTVSRQVKTGIDEKAMKQDGIWDKYHTKQTTSYVLTVKENKEEN